MTVEDVKWSLDRAIASNYVNYIVSFIESVEITGENTIVIHCAEPYACLLYTSYLSRVHLNKSAAWQAKNRG